MRRPPLVFPIEVQLNGDPATDTYLGCTPHVAMKVKIEPPISNRHQVGRPSFVQALHPELDRHGSAPILLELLCDLLIDKNVRVDSLETNACSETYFRHRADSTCGSIDAGLKRSLFAQHSMALGSQFNFALIGSAWVIAALIKHNICRARTLTFIVVKILIAVREDFLWRSAGRPALINYAALILNRCPLPPAGALMPSGQCRRRVFYRYRRCHPAHECGTAYRQVPWQHQSLRLPAWLASRHQRLS
jgi:hypothetical protein